MRNSLALVCGIGILAVCGAAIAGLSLGQPEGEVDRGRELAERYQKEIAQGGMARWMASITPEMAHEFLQEKFVGDWVIDMTFDSGGMRMETSWEGESRATMGGRFVEMRFTGQMMGMPVESLMVLGYDVDRRLFHATLFDTMDTGVRTMWGNIDKEGRVLTMIGEMDEPMSGEMGKAFKLSWTFNDDGTVTQEVSEILYGDPFVVVTGAMRRAE